MLRENYEICNIFVVMTTAVHEHFVTQIKALLACEKYLSIFVCTYICEQIGKAVLLFVNGSSDSNFEDQMLTAGYLLYLLPSKLVGYFSHVGKTLYIVLSGSALILIL